MKNCLFCNKFEISYEADYSDITPGEGLVIRCGILHWWFSHFGDTEEDFRRKMETAKTCEDYDPIQIS